MGLFLHLVGALQELLRTLKAKAFLRRPQTRAHEMEVQYSLKMRQRGPMIKIGVCLLLNAAECCQDEHTVSEEPCSSARQPGYDLDAAAGFEGAHSQNKPLLADQRRP